jgi:hypothetical protein
MLFKPPADLRHHMGCGSTGGTRFDLGTAHHER